MPEIDDWGYDEWADAAQRGAEAEASQRRYEQRMSERRYGKKQPPKRQSQFEFAQLDRYKLLESKLIAQDAWDTYRKEKTAEISKQTEQCYAAIDANEPDAEEISGLAHWEKNSQLIVLAYQVGLREVLNLNRGRELFESGEGRLFSRKN